MRDRNFDEVMIVNPVGRAGEARGVRLMPYAYPEMGYYAAPVYGADDPAYGAYDLPPEMSGWGEADGYGYAGDPAYAAYDPRYGAQPAYGYQDPAYGEPEPVGYFADEYGEYGDYADCGEYGDAGPEPLGACGAYSGCAGCASCPNAVHDAGPAEVGHPPDEAMGEDPMGYAAEPELYGYEPEVPSPHNASFPSSAPLSDAEPGMDGFVRPAPVGPTVERFTSAPGSGGAVPETFRPLW